MPDASSFSIQTTTTRVGLLAGGIAVGIGVGLGFAVGIGVGLGFAVGIGDALGFAVGIGTPGATNVGVGLAAANGPWVGKKLVSGVALPAGAGGAAAVAGCTVKVARAETDSGEEFVRLREVVVASNRWPPGGALEGIASDRLNRPDVSAWKRGIPLALPSNRTWPAAPGTKFAPVTVIVLPAGPTVG